MRCRDFRNNHVAFVDDTLPGVEMAAMREHLERCPRCARHDMAVRRGLMLFRSLPQIEPSPDFSERLRSRLRAVDSSPRPVTPRTGALYGGPGAFAFAYAAAGVAAAAYLALAAYERATAPVRDIVLPPVVATAPAPEPSPIATPAIAATLSTGFPVWQAVLLAEQAPLHFMNAELREETR